MKHSFLFIIAMAIEAQGSAAQARGFQAFYDAPGFVIPDNDPTGATSSVHTDPLDVIAAMTITLRFPLTSTAGGHTWCGDLIATLTFTPDGGGPSRSVDLFNRIGADSAISRGDSSDFRSTYNFFATAQNPTIWEAAGLADFDQRIPANDYKPSTRSATYMYEQTSYLQAFGNSTPAGTWSLNISDHAIGDTGRLLSWSIYPFVPASGTAFIIATLGLTTLRRRR